MIYFSCNDSANRRKPVGIPYGGELAQWYSTHPLIQRSLVRFRALSHTGITYYDESCKMHLTSGVVHNFPKAVGV